MTHLPEDPTRYFKATPGTELVPLSKLRPTRKRPAGVKDARVAMALAYKGGGGRRNPISVEKDPGGRTYTILDGNSTYAVAKANGWKKLPAIIRRGGSMAEQLSRAIVPICQAD